MFVPAFVPGLKFSWLGFSVKISTGTKAGGALLELVAPDLQEPKALEPPEEETSVMFTIGSKLLGKVLLDRNPVLGIDE